ncbi:MAG: fibrobacter succinogenes major paralogous domain-containing protein [Bacteroidia bacterium]
MKKTILIICALAVTSLVLLAWVISAPVSNASGNSSYNVEVLIGNQIWMRENLNTDTFRNGDKIPHAKTNTEWKNAGRHKQPAWCYCENDSNGKKYGRLYNWYAVNDPRGLAPEGWHIPAIEEWTQLYNFLGKKNHIVDPKLKSATGWPERDKGRGNGTNESGFSALPGGFRYDDGNYYETNEFGFWWSVTKIDRYEACGPGINMYYNGAMSDFANMMGNGRSVRCVKNQDKKF